VCGCGFAFPTNSTVQIFPETQSYLVDQEIPCFFRMWKVKFRLHKSPSLDSTTRHLSPSHAFTCLFLYCVQYCFHTLIFLPSGLLFWNVSSHILMYSFLLFPYNNVPPPLLYLITIITTGVEKSYEGSECASLLILLFTSSVLFPHIFLNIRNILNLWSSFVVRDQVSHQCVPEVDNVLLLILLLLLLLQ